jgi:hypothetical protein
MKLFKVQSLLTVVVAEAKDEEEAGNLVRKALLHNPNVLSIRGETHAIPIMMWDFINTDEAVHITRMGEPYTYVMKDLDTGLILEWRNEHHRKSSAFYVPHEIRAQAHVFAKSKKGKEREQSK